MNKIKNKLFVWAHRGVGTICRRIAWFIVGFLVEHNFFGAGHDSVLEEKAATVFTSLLVGLFELALFFWRTRNGKNIQRAAGVKEDGVIGDIQTPELVKRLKKQSIHGGRPV